MMKEVSRAIILSEDDKVLIGRRARGIAAGQLALIGGKPDPGEPPIVAIIREVEEELGLKFSPEPYLEMVDSDSEPGVSWKLYVFTGKATGKLLLNEEIAEVIFVSENDLDELDIAFNHKELLREYFTSRRS
ncbi:MAG TPA: NUDIX hydrolase [Clostridia bacterium]|nr:NUDIX hydrolase [Clostridia bacterium]